MSELKQKILIFIITFLTGWMPEINGLVAEHILHNTPQDTISKYNKYLNDNEFKSAYELFSDKYKQHTSFSKYLEYIKKWDKGVISYTFYFNNDEISVLDMEITSMMKNGNKKTSEKWKGLFFLERTRWSWKIDSVKLYKSN